jgi:hypothetical protein
MAESTDEKWLWNRKLLGYISRHLNCFIVNIDSSDMFGSVRALEMKLKLFWKQL